MIMEDAQVYIKDCNLSNNGHNFSLDEFYKYITCYSEEGYIQVDKIVKSLQCQINDGKVTRDVLYLSLLCSIDTSLLNELVNYEKSHIKLFGSPGSLYDFTIYKTKQWFEEFTRQNNDSTILFDSSIIKVIDVLKLVHYTKDISNINQEELQTNFEDVDEFWKTYNMRIKFLWSVVTYCTAVQSNIDVREVFLYSSQNATLKTFFNYFDMENFKDDKIVQFLQHEDSLFNFSCKTQIDNFLLYSIIMIILQNIQNIQSLSNINSLVLNLREKLSSINNKKLVVEVLENIFTILFTKTDYFSIKDLEGFVCQEPEIRLILFLLRELFDEVKIKGLIGVNSKEFCDFLNIQKHVTNALWRMGLISSVKSNQKCERKLLKYMLSMPESLIQMCLKEGDYDRAYQVVKIFSLKDALSTEIDYCQKLRRLKQSLKKMFNKLGVVEDSNIQMSTKTIEEVVKDFFAKNPVITNPDIENLINIADFGLMKHLKEENALFAHILDLAITQPTNFTGSEIMLHLAFEFNKLDNSVASTYLDFSKKLCEMITTEEYPKTSLGDMLTFGSYSLDIHNFVKDNELHSDLAKFYDEFQEKMNHGEIGVLNSNHPSHTISLKLSNICSINFRECEINTKYLYKLLNYLKAFSKVLYIDRNNSDIISHGKNSSFFDILSHNRSELMGELLFERSLDPDEFERYFGKLKLDYLYHVIGNCFPTINLHTEQSLAEEELYPDNVLYIPKKNILEYIQKRNWLLAFILNEMYQVEGVDVGITTIRVKTFLNFSNISAVRNLTEIYNNNKVIAAIQNEINIHKLKQYINSEIAKYESPTSTSDRDPMAVEVGEDISECMTRRKRISHLLNVIDSVSEIQLTANDFIVLKDKFLAKMVEEYEYFGFIKNIADKQLRMKILFKNMRHMPGTICIDLLKSETTKFEDIDDDELLELKSWLTRIIFYEQLGEILAVTSWSEACDMCHNNKDVVIPKLLSQYNIHLLLKFIYLHTPNEEILLTITESFVLEMFDRLNNYDNIGKLLDDLPFQHVTRMCYNFLGKLKRISQLEYITSYLLSKIPNDENLKKVQISLKLLKEFSENEQEQLLDLLQQPMCIIEVLIMNMKFDKLQVAISFLRLAILHHKFSCGAVSDEKIDLLLRRYAEKSLDFRVISHPNPRLLRTPECKLMQSMDSLSLINDLNRQFVMPDEVPRKEEWVSNDEVIECMCCQKIVFSMFSRRHHCRRCGRVVCYYCSNRRMLVPSYGDVLVRVCRDCYHQTIGNTSTSSDLNDTSIKSALNDFWILTNNPEHNEIIREEFSYEDVPNISLCFTIMKFHRKTPEYPKLLLDQCGILLQLIQPSHANVEEIDYFLVIKMLKHLATAAKMASVECTEHYGISSADRILSQADLLNLFVERGCLNLLPVANSNSPQSSYIDSSILRRLCDKLLEKEQWNLALEVSTKAGLDRIGVFSAWGKSCLRAGNLLLARDIFQRCLDKSGFNESMSDLSIASDSYDGFRKSTPLSKSSLQIGYETKSSKNPTLLKEIIKILESSMKLVRSNSNETFHKQLTGSAFTLNNLDSDNAVYILNKMKNLKNISEGNYSQFDGKQQSQNFSRKPGSNIFYDECIFYLGKYGTHMNLLDFLIKNGNIYEALKYIIDNQLNPDVFIQVYLKCLKDGLIGILQGYILTIDASFELWKEYLRFLCRHLVKQNMLNSLYQLQQFMGDHVRAAMTCMKFYQENVKSFSDLLGNTKYLNKAEKHLNDLLEQDQWIEVSPVHRLSTSMNSFEEKNINNSSLIMNMDPDDISKHICTVKRQKEIVKFLSDRENTNEQSVKIILDSFQSDPQEEPTVKIQPISKIPTLFGLTSDKIKLAVLVILSGENVEDGFKIGQGIIDDFNLKAINVYCEAGKILAKLEKYHGISQLVSCIKHVGSNSEIVNNMCDEMLTTAVATLSKANCSGTKVEDLIKLISDRPTKISAYIEAKQLKTAYFLAVKYKRTSDIKRIMKEAEMLNQPNIKILCQKVLSSQHHPSQIKK